MALEKFRAPALPIPTNSYDPQQQLDLIRALRIYFNQLDSLTPNQAQSYRADDFYGGRFFGDGYGVRLPHIAASDSTDQYASGNDVPTLVLWDTLDSGLGFTLNPAGYATPTYSGVYKIDYSLQFANTANAAYDVYVWLQVTGSQVPNSSSKFTLQARKSAGVATHIVAYSSVTFEIQAGDAIRLYWATSQAYNPVGPIDGIYMEHEDAQTVPYVRPANPSAVGSITFVSALS